MSEYSESSPSRDGRMKDVRPSVDEVDRRILEILAVKARIPNNALADQVGISASTCLGRVRALVDRGVIRGFYADIDPEAVGLSVQAIIAVTLQADARDAIPVFRDRLAAMPGVRDVFFVAGTHDFLVHVVVRDTADLRKFVVVNLSGSSEVAATDTSLVFEHVHTRRL